MAKLIDDEFGEIDVRKLRSSRAVRVSVAPSGKLRATMPFFASVRSLKSLIESSRPDIRKMLLQQRPEVLYHDGAQVGKSHSLLVTTGPSLKVRRQKLKIIAELPPETSIDDPVAQAAVRTQVQAALRVEAKHYLPRRLERLADQHGYSYERVRFSHASTRWGSCSSTGTISLNIALMQLPFELIDYVLLHELCHTRQMNHSSDFWDLVAQADPDYLQHRRTLKKHSPTI